MRHSPYRELTIRRPPCRKTSMHSQDLLSNETAFESDFPARRPFYSLQKLPTYINVTATRNISFPKSGVRARPVLLSFNAEGCKRKLVPLPVRASGFVPYYFQPSGRSSPSTESSIFLSLTIRSRRAVFGSLFSKRTLFTSSVIGSVT